MELIDYLRSMGKRWLILLIIPLIAGIAAAAIVYQQPRVFHAKTTVRLPVAADAPSSVISQANSDFTQALTSDAVLSQVAEKSGVDKATLKSGLTVKQSGSSRILDVTYTAHGKKKALKAADLSEAASHAALVTLLAPEVANQRKQLDEAQKSYTQARSALDQFSAKSGSTLPEDEYRQALGTVSQLQTALLALQATNGTVDAGGHPIDNSAAIKSYQDAIAAQQAQITNLKGLVAQSAPLEDAVQSALANVTTAQRSYQDAVAAQASVDAPATLITSKVVKNKTVTRLVKTVGVTVAVGIVLAVTILVLMELIRPSSRKKRTPTREAPSAPPTSSEPPLPAEATV